jgi:predicted dehydrogenase
MVSSHAGAYRAVKEVELVAVCDLNPEKLEKCGRRWGIRSLYQDYREMLRKERLDILSICTWNSTHLEIAKEAVEQGVKAIFCEKPIAESLRKADEMIQICRERNVLLQIDHQRRFDPFHREVQRYLHQGGLGRMQQVTFYYTAGIANTGSHMFDLLRFFFGEVEWVWGIYSQNASPDPNDPNIDGIMKFRSGLSGTIQACDDLAFRIFEIDCIGTKGRLNITHSGFDIEYYSVADSSFFSGYKWLFPASPPLNRDMPREFMVEAVQHLVHCLKTREKPLCSGEDGRASLELICAFQESARDGGRKVELPLQDSEIEIHSR